MCSSCQSPLTFFCTFCQLPPPPPPPSLHPSSTAGRLSSISDYVEIKRETEDMCGATGRSCQTSLGTAIQQGRTTTASSKGGKGRTVLGLPGSRTVSGLLGNKRHKPTRAVTQRAAQNTIRAGKALHSARRPKSARCDNGPSSEGRDESEADRGTYSPMAVNICVNEAKTVDRDPTLQDLSGSMEECFSSARTSGAHADSPGSSSALEWADDPTQCLQREKPFVCSICNKAFSLPCKLKIHRRKHSGQRPYTCKMCCASYITMFSLTRHINNKHIGFRPHSCKQCSKAFFESAALKRHMLLHSDAKPHVCSECDAAFSLKYILQKHRLIHSGQAHSETKHTEKRFLCSECGACFGQKQSLVSHMHKHAGIKPHVCPQCGAAFTEKGTLRSHLRLHTDDRPYVCESCGERWVFSSPSYW